MKKRIFLILVLLFPVYLAQAQDWEQVVKACASDRLSDSYYGNSVAIDGNYAVVGANGDDFDTNGENRKINAGAAYVLHFNGTTWVEVQKLVASDRAAYDYFGCSVAISGDYIMVGANMDDNATSTNLGSVYVFYNNAGVWTETQKIASSDRHEDDFFGSALSLNGDYAIVGVYLQDYNTAGLDSVGNGGAAYIFKNIAGTWTETQKLIASDRSATDYFGFSVDIEGDYAIIGAYAEDEDANGVNTQVEAGSAYIFKNYSDTWIEEQKIVASDRYVEDYFGYSVSISNNYVIVGAYYEDEDELGSETISGAGSVYIYENNEGVWSQVNKVVSSDRNENDRFGYSVSISGDYAVVGAFFEDEDSFDLNHLDFSGSAYVLKNTGGVWQQSRKITALDRQEQDYFGISVAICDTMIIAGAKQQDYDSTGGGIVETEAGAAYLFKLALRDINVWQDETFIVNESTFVMQEVTAGTSSGPIVFRVENEGVTNLNLIGDPKLVISGVDASYFDLDFTMLASTIEPFESSYFTVTFNPDEARDFQAQISIANNDENENPFHFIINAPGGKIPQNIYNFDPIAEKTYGDEPFEVSALASSGLDVVFTSSDPTVAVCSGMNGTTITIIGAGICSIFANQSGTDLFEVAPEISQQLIVNPKPITINVDSKTKIYGDPDPEFTFTCIPDLIFGDLFSGTLTRVLGENAQESYEILQGTLTAGDNYLISYNSGYLTINPKTITVVANSGQNKIYGDANPTAYTYSITAGELVGGDAFSGALIRETGENVGLYSILLGTLSLGTNYNLVYEAADFEIIPRDITITADAGQFKEYGTPDLPLTYSFSEWPLGGNSFTGALSRVSGEDIGFYEINIGTLSLGSNYSIYFVSDVFEITTREVNIVVYENQYKSYGQEDPIFTYWLSGTLVGGDVITGELSREPGEAIGFYEINQGTISAGPNYNLTVIPENFEIRTMMIIAFADPAQTKFYGDPNPSQYTYSYVGTLAPGDHFNGALTRVSGENIGDYQITQGTLSLNSNYNLSFIADYFEITKRPITVSADPGQTKVYGTANPEVYTYTITDGNLVGSDNFSGSIRRYFGEDVGQYSIHQGTLTLSQNYQLTYVSDVFTITEASLTIIADAGHSKIYGDSDPVLTYTTNFQLMPGDSFTGSLSREEGENTGIYEINQGTLSPGPNYTTVFIPANFEIYEKDIVVTADAGQTKVYGDADPELTYTTNTPIASWDSFTGMLARETGENVGFYEIQLGDLALNSNYNIEFISADFEILKATPFITWTNPADIYNNEALSATQLNATASVDGTFTYDPDFGAYLNVGDNQPLNTEFLPEDNVNYNNVIATVYINVLLNVGTLEFSEKDIAIYPNPTNGIVNFDFAGNEVQSIRITDVSGKLIFEKSNILQNETLDLSTNPAGVYFVSIQTNDKVITSKIVLQ